MHLYMIYYDGWHFLLEAHEVMRRLIRTWEEKDEHLQVEVERAPRGRLMLRNRRDDGNVIFGVAWVEQGVKTTGPRRDF